MPKVLLLYVDAGYGHRKVAEAVYREMVVQNYDTRELEIFDALKMTHFLFGHSYGGFYFRMVVHAPKLWGFLFSLTNSRFAYPLISPFRTFWNWLQSFNLRNYVQKGNFDHIIFTHFFPAEVCATLKRRGKIKSNLITIVTDVIPHRVWINSGTDHYWVMAEESANMVASHGGVDRRQIHVKGIPVSSDFLKPVNRTAIRKKLELDENRLTILFTSGSFGIGPTEEVLNSFSELKDHIQVIVVCGNNKALLHTLNGRQFQFPIRLFGFVDNMHELMSASDLLIAKPGGATMCESLVKGLPMIMTSPIPGQESANAEWLSSHQAAFKINDPSEIKNIVKRIIQNPGLLESNRSAIKRIAKPEATKDIATSILNDFKK